jgi:tRNA (cmo5U34)-methyltransferase
LSKTDDIYSQPIEGLPAFQFDSRVAEVFPDMIKRSVPGYAYILKIIGQIAARHATPGSRCYDLGCSLGAGLLTMMEQVEDQSVEFIGIDNSPAMIEKCQELIRQSDIGVRSLTLAEADICEIELNNASVCLLNFTLQFVNIENRPQLLSQIYQGMQDGGVLILSEKLSFDNPQHTQLMQALHHDFKRYNGYSELEISQKRDAIENVLMPESFETHKQRLLDAGFRQVDLCFQCFNFASILAFK